MWTNYWESFLTFLCPSTILSLFLLYFSFYVVPRSILGTPYLRWKLHYLPFLSWPWPPRQLSVRPLATQYLLIHSQLGCTYDFTRDPAMNTAPPLPIFWYQIMPTACFPLPALRLQNITRESHWAIAGLITVDKMGNW